MSLLSHTSSPPLQLELVAGWKWLAFTMSVKAPSETIVKPRPKPKGAKWADKPITVSTTRYQYDGRGIVAPPIDIFSLCPQKAALHVS